MAAGCCSPTVWKTCHSPHRNQASDINWPSNRNRSRTSPYFSQEPVRNSSRVSVHAARPQIQRNPVAQASACVVFFLCRGDTTQTEVCATKSHFASQRDTTHLMG